MPDKHPQTAPLSDSWHTDHSFGQAAKRPGEPRTMIVIAITVTMMVIEITAGAAFGSIALLADGLHMAAHAAALSVAAFAYIYARRHADDPRFSFGTGKVNALSGFTGGILLAVFAAMMVWESVERLLHPQPILYNQAIVVAVVGLIVNGVCAVILGHTHNHGEDADSDHEHSGDGPHHHGAGHDHNLQAAYFHVLADALTSILAITALLAGKYFQWNWADPLIGIVGAIVVFQWCRGLVRSTSRVLLDRQANEETLAAIRRAIESDNDRVVDLHVWSIGPQIYAAEIVIAATAPLATSEYKRRLPANLGLAHVAIELHTKCESRVETGEPVG
ncbi:MAG: CDF family Co(II)/Ni(II) efflux transporter DmeF [Pirellulaceae bacterium]|jgi:cation diffusion facilitator family transporter|nr:CDF family Co(II)/Ni(II) efflux transporter DmeF [Pirellulaceae bacterium]